MPYLAEVLVVSFVSLLVSARLLRLLLLLVADLGLGLPFGHVGIVVILADLLGFSQHLLELGVRVLAAALVVFVLVLRIAHR